MLDVGCKCFLFDIDVEQLKQVLGFDKDYWLLMVDQIWVNEVYVYYGQ